MTKREVKYYNGKYCGQYLTDDTCKMLDKLRVLDSKGGSVKELEHSIYNLSDEDVEKVKKNESNKGIELGQGTLRPIQTVGAAYMYYAERLVLGDSVGMGKTVEVCALFNILQKMNEKNGKPFHFLYLTGKNLVQQGQDEIIKFTGEYVQKVYGTKDKISKFCKENKELKASVVGSHSLLKSMAFQEYIYTYIQRTGKNPFDILVIDEAGDVLVNSNTQTYKAAKEIGKYFNRIVLLNATSFEKELLMFYNQLSFVDNTFLPTKTEFSKRYEVFDYSGPYPMFKGKYKNQEEFKGLVEYRYLARTRKSSGATMTNCSADVVKVPLSKEQRKLLKLTSMPYMVYDCPGYFGMGVETNPETTPKLKALISLLNNELKDEKSILVYSRYKEAQSAIQDCLVKNGIDARILNGDSSQKEREEVIDRFKKSEFRVLVTNVQKGLNFGNCNVCIFYTYDPNPNKMVQFEGRMTRSYNIDNKHVYLIISKGRELKTFKETVSDRAKASDVFTGSDFSCVLGILLDKKKVEDL